MKKSKRVRWWDGRRGELIMAEKKNKWRYFANEAGVRWYEIPGTWSLRITRLRKVWSLRFSLFRGYKRRGPAIPEGCRRNSRFVRVPPVNKAEVTG
jgi:hypothetical protein